MIQHSRTTFSGLIESTCQINCWWIFSSRQIKLGFVASEPRDRTASEAISHHVWTLSNAEIMHCKWFFHVFPALEIMNSLTFQNGQAEFNTKSLNLAFRSSNYLKVTSFSIWRYFCWHWSGGQWNAEVHVYLSLDLHALFAGCVWSNQRTARALQTAISRGRQEVVGNAMMVNVVRQVQRTNELSHGMFWWSTVILLLGILKNTLNITESSESLNVQRIVRSQNWVSASFWIPKSNDFVICPLELAILIYFVFFCYPILIYNSILF